MAVVLIFFFFMMFLIIAPLAFTTIEPLYTIKNYDEHLHNATVIVTGYNEEYLEETDYQLSSGQTVSVEKPKKLLLKWSNPFKDGYLHYASGDSGIIITILYLKICQQSIIQLHTLQTL
jgi:hypothetical protein